MSTSDSWRGTYDSWRTATPPEYERDEPDEDEDVCDECDTVNLTHFIHPAEGVFIRRRCEACEELEGVGF